MALQKSKGKRPAPAAQGPSKKRKLSGKFSTQKNKATKDKSKAKVEKAADRGIIPIPSLENQQDVDLSDQDMEVLQEFGQAASFLERLDHKGIMRSKKETSRLHQLNKPVRKVTKEDDLPSIDSHDEDEGSWSSGIEDESSLASDDEDSGLNGGSSDSDVEMPYETAPRKRRPSWEAPEKREIQRLPIKLADGKIQKSGSKSIAQVDKDSEDDQADMESEKENQTVEHKPLDDVSTGARFGRTGVLDIVGVKSRKSRIAGAKVQIASICQEILADPENSLGLLRRLHVFSQKEISTPTHPDPVPNDPIIRKLAILSQLAVFKDIIPGYRIRALTDKEKSENVGQMIARTREWEQGLVVIYQSYLRGLEAELKVRSELADTALHCMCTLLIEVTHFNFRVNLMTCIVTRLSRKSWDKSSDLCLDTLIKVFRADMIGTASLEIVRLMNRMVKERRFNIHPNVLSCLLHLRLRTELGVRASDSRADKHTADESNTSGRKAKKVEKPHLSKKAKKALKEKKEIDKELREAEAEVDKEERAVTQTETLKLLFALYFRILKSPKRTPLLPAALSGISRFAHLVNIDFFQDLMKVLKHLIELEEEDEDEDEDEEITYESIKDLDDVSQRLLCIVTAFELLLGQGEALNLDLTDFVSRLYAMILPLTLVRDIDTRSYGGGGSGKSQSVADMLFRALNIVFSPRTFGVAAPPWRSAAFAKRLLSAALHWPPNVALRALDFVRGLIAKDSKLEALLSTEDRIFDGIYRPEVDDPQLSHPFGSSFYELHALCRHHWDAKVRKEAHKLLTFTSS
ncbi:nucleolar complex-associated protein-domain-containing protein [Crucibulum laeve]|uniref:Nucleolar complex-associated protein 3 n=1 Tax=Crucibulum laeve TaxID=68775 RepID=A0A5C3MD99_9AGAR|nr:nucleolar complex-associated protein-domain-containing protein [Crucibulum laeve]